jgi:sulfate-transporting ATPase
MVTHDNDFARVVDRSVIVADGEVINEYVARALAALNIDQLGWVAGRLQTHQFAPGAEIVQQGDVADRFYIITRGQVEIVLDHPGGTQIIVNQLERGQYFGEMALINEGRRTASVRAAAHVPVEVVTLDRESFLAVLAESEAARTDMANMVRQRASHLADLDTQPRQ